MKAPGYHHQWNPAIHIIILPKLDPTRQHFCQKTELVKWHSLSFMLRFPTMQIKRYLKESPFSREKKGEKNAKKREFELFKLLPLGGAVCNISHFSEDLLMFCQHAYRFNVKIRKLLNSWLLFESKMCGESIFYDNSTFYYKVTFQVRIAIV